MRLDRLDLSFFMQFRYETKIKIVKKYELAILFWLNDFNEKKIKYI